MTMSLQLLPNLFLMPFESTLLEAVLRDSSYNFWITLLRIKKRLWKMMLRRHFAWPAEN
jgi:hypothetical protein